MQAAHYLDAYTALRRLALSGRVFGKCPLTADWAKRIVGPDDIRWVWVFHGMDGAPTSKGREISPFSPVLTKAMREVSAAKAIYRDNLDRFGTDQWTDREPVRELTEADMVPWLREDVEVL